MDLDQEARVRRRAEARRRIYRRRRITAAAIVAVLAVGIAAVVVMAGSGSDDDDAAGPADRVAQSMPEEPTELTIAVSGDLLIHGPVFAQALANGGGANYDFRPMLDRVREIVRGADLGICHLEVPLTGDAPSGYPVFGAPASLANAIRWTGWDACSNASNHTFDRGQEGVDFTVRRLDRAGIAHSGANAKPSTSHVAMMEAKGVKVALLAYTTRIIGMPLPDNDWALNMAEPKKMLADAKAARKAGAAVVIVSLHWGDEYVHEPNDLQRRLAGILTRSPDVTAVIGQHVHVVQPTRKVNGKPVVFGEGNLLSNQTYACCPAESQDGTIVLLHIEAGPDGARVENVRYVPTWVEHPAFEVVPATGESRRRTIGYVGRAPWLKPVPAG
jgi:poly-gamma-glutamate capsule biosynthesis protein CapA/YwtB (metallophosphatase superfamily)